MDNPVAKVVTTEAESMLPDLEYYLREPELQSKVVLESIYARYGSIMGPALTDSFHIGQTWWNDFGRPLGRGGSLIAGYALRATSGRYFFYSRQELQTHPGLPAVSQSLADYYKQIDNDTFSGPAPPNFNLASPPISAYVRQRPIDLYAGMAFAGYSLSFGKQEIYWGPNTMGPLSFSSNAEPTYNLRLTSNRPHDLPFIPSLGTYSVDLVFGKLSGHRYPARPYFNGQKINFNLGRNLEISFTRWSILWGVGHPMTLRSLKDNFFSSNSTGSNFGYGDREDPGDRKSAFDFRLHVPGLSNLVTIYSDSYADDDLNPLDAPRRNVWAPGIYVARLPGMSHMDFRFEVTSTEELSQDEGNHRIYINNQYRDGNTNKSFLLGNVTGRDARAYEGRLGYWVSARTRVEGGYRQEKISPLHLTNGGTVSDGFVRANYAIGKDWNVELFSQIERFLIPVLGPERQTNGSVRLQITWDPNKVIGHLRSR
ncbi:capsule assembly Wzi family protein [Terriglobus roseus]|uniref:capsule assembly Wzi family protein n=1 Tax=Terriglobus roseus TaxID=392734 RepID=UPI001E4FE177|nr:capsule assembly Wzi family protein [Terriglobus roseus]